MDFKVFTRGNYFIVEDIVSGKLYEGLKKEVKVMRTELVSSVFSFIGLSNIDSLLLDINNIKKENGDDYTLNEFITFYSENTGNFSTATGGSVAYSYTERLIGTYLGEDLYQITTQTSVITNGTSGSLSLIQCAKLISAEATNNVETIPLTIRAENNGGDAVNPVFSVTCPSGEVVVNWSFYPYTTGVVYITLRYTK